MTRRRSTLAQIRAAEYRNARLLGDIRAVQTGQIPRRIRNRIVGRWLTRAMRSWK